MAQYLKDAVEQSIRAAALREFARHGFEGTTVADIARAAGVSTGNVYRYFDNKQLLFRAVVPPELPRRVMALLRSRVRAMTGETEHVGLDQHDAAEALVEFSVRHRLELVVLLGRAEGTVYATFADKVKTFLMQRAVSHVRGLDGAALDDATAFALRLVYDNWVCSMVRILEEHDDADAIRERVARYTGFHLAGVKSLLSMHSRWAAPVPSQSAKAV